jgi:hypothetical protein
MSAGRDLREGLTMEVSLLNHFIGLQIGLRKTLVDGRLSPAAEEVLENHTSQLLNRRPQKTTADSPSTPRKQTGPPSNLLHLPRAGGGGRRRGERCRNLAADEKLSDAAAHNEKSGID